ncbi:hypothetical protein niasHT_004006 [Heterodera trifolii]|uniref:Uncharacterized protein n=1 Tax=Heterodera trifolii TaxID=157864 RepID=A0ABD2M4B8_9BILA
MVRPTKGTIQKRNAAAAGRAVIEAQKARMAALNGILARSVPAWNGDPAFFEICQQIWAILGQFLGELNPVTFGYLTKPEELATAWASSMPAQVGLHPLHHSLPMKRLVSSLAHEGLHILEFQQGRQWPRAGTSTKHDHGPFFRAKCAELIEISGGLIQPECKEFDHL